MLFSGYHDTKKRNFNYETYPYRAAVSACTCTDSDPLVLCHDPPKNKRHAAD